MTPNAKNRRETANNNTELRQTEVEQNSETNLIIKKE